MTRWAMAADLRRCVGCQTCTAACRHTNATSPAVQWRKVLDFEVGEFPDVRRAFVPVGCMHCADPPCMHVCPSTATRQRPDGIVTINYDLCIGCAYCMVACPYQARFKVTEPTYAYKGATPMANEKARFDPARLGVAQKCTFCSDRIDFGLENGLTPGVDPEATPACVNSCIADALHFGDVEDEDSLVSTLIRNNKHFLMHDELGTGSGFYYLWESAGGEEGGADQPLDRTARPGSDDLAPRLQTQWDWRAAGNFILGGAGGGLLVAAGALAGVGMAPFALVALACVGLGLFLVWLETGRPWRAPLNVFFNPQTSWMTRESMAALVLGVCALAAAAWATPTTALLAAAAGFAFLYCQGRILLAAKGIPAWREPLILPLIITTGLAEGIGLYLVAGQALAPWSAPAAVYLSLWAAALLAAARGIVWLAYRRRLADNAPGETKRVLDKIHPEITLLGLGVPLTVIAATEIFPGVADSHLGMLAVVAGIGAVAGGWYMKFVIVARASYNQGYAIVRTPERGAGGGGAGAKPGWS